MCALITRDGGKNGPLLATYVTKYFHDMSAHFAAAFRHVKSGGQATYIIGNSTFYGHVVPAERWYASLLRAAGFTDVRISVLRKRNSNLALYEYEVTASTAVSRPSRSFAGHRQRAEALRHRHHLDDVDVHVRRQGRRPVHRLGHVAGFQRVYSLRRPGRPGPGHPRTGPRRIRCRRTGPARRW